jgi:hypothetical protein
VAGNKLTQNVIKKVREHLSFANVIFTVALSKAIVQPATAG